MSTEYNSIFSTRASAWSYAIFCIGNYFTTTENARDRVNDKWAVIQSSINFFFFVIVNDDVDEDILNTEYWIPFLRYPAEERIFLELYFTYVAWRKSRLRFLLYKHL